MKKTLHVSPDTKSDLEFLKKHFGVRSESDVVEILVQLYYQTENFPRNFLHLLLDKNNGKDNDPVVSRPGRTDRDAEG